MDTSSLSSQTLGYLISVTMYGTICLVAIVTAITIVGSIAFFRSTRGSAKTFSLLLQRAGALQLVTVMTIIAGACILTIIGKINSEGIVSILSGIAGYVLGGIPRGGLGHAEESDKTPE